MIPLHLNNKIINRFILLLFGVFCIVALQAQKEEKTTNVILENAESLTFDKTHSAERQVLRGNVRFRHEGAVMHCDSAYFYSESNSLDAFGHVKMVQGDTLFVYSDVLYYDGNKKLALLRRNVRMINRDVVLTTESLDYDRVKDMGYYFENGKITDPTNVLVSKKGFYYPKQKLAEFKTEVLLTNPDFVIKSDTLKYNTNTKVAYLVGPSNIDYADTHIYSELGSYNTQTEYSSLFKRSQVETKDGRFLTGDTIYYDKAKGLGRVFSDIEIKDTIQKVMLKGDIGIYNEITGKAFVTKSALAIEYSSPDSLFLHADTLFYNKDSIYNDLQAYHHVRFFRSDLQGKCDSVFYSSRDSILTMYYEPVIWSENNQLTGDEIQILMNNGKVDYIYVHANAMAAMQDLVDTVKFNQLVGKEMKAYVRDNEVYKIDVSGNTQSIYFPRESDSTLVGVNKTESSFMTVYLKENKVDKVILYPGASGKMLPDENLVKEDIFFPQFIWHDAIRPKKMEDIFIQTEPTVKKKEEKKRRR